MKKKVIFHSGSLRMGGLERVLIEVLQNLDLEKIDIKLLIEDEFKEENIFEKDIPKEIEITYLIPEYILQKTKKLKLQKKNIIYKIGYNLMMQVERYIRNKNLKLFLNENKADVLIDFDNGLKKDIHKIKNMKKIAWLHNSIPSLKKTKSKIERFGKRLNNYDIIVAICNDMKKETEELYPFLEGKVKRIYNPFNFKRIKNLSNDKTKLTKKEIEKIEKNYILAVSRLDNVQKDYFTLLKAFKKLKIDGIKEKLYIVGDGPDKKEIESLIKELRLEDEVELLGQQKNPYVWMKNANLFVHSSKYEGFGLVLVEAMITGRGIVSTNCPVGPSEILENGKVGILVKMENINDMKIGLIEGLKRRKELEIKSLKRCKNFDVKIIKEKYYELFE